MSDKYVLNLNGDPVPETDLLAWARWFETSNDKRRGARDEIGDHTVSTVFLGIDHSFGGPVPILYETMVFRDGASVEEYERRYSTKDEAERGHAETVVALTEKIR
jgi:hypothetical protein